VLCAWLLKRRRVTPSLAGALAAVRTVAPLAAPNFGFISQLVQLEPGAPQPSIRVWEYAGLSWDQWATELRNGGGGGGGGGEGGGSGEAGLPPLTKRSARRILALGRRLLREGSRGAGASVPSVGAAIDFSSLIEVD